MPNDEARTPVTPQADHERLSPNEWEAIARHLEQHDLPRTAERVRAAADQLERNAEESSTILRLQSNAATYGATGGQMIADLEALLAKYAHINGSIQRELANPPSQTLFGTGELVILATYLDALPAILTALRAAETLMAALDSFKNAEGVALASLIAEVDALRSALAALGEGPRSGGDSCPREGCTHLPDGGPVAKDGVYRGARFCLCHQFETGPYARSEGPRERKS